MGKIHNEDIFVHIPFIEDKAFHTVITSPPYFQQRSDSKFGNEDSVGEYIDNMVWLTAHLARITDDSGSIFVNMGDKRIDGSMGLIPYRYAIAVQDQLGLILKNEITWHKPNPTPMSGKSNLVVGKEPVFQFTKTDRAYMNIESYRDSLPSKNKDKDQSYSSIGQSYYDMIRNSRLSEAEKNAAEKELSRSIEMVKNNEITGIRMKIRDVHAVPYGGQSGGRNNQIQKNGYTIIHLHGKPQISDVISIPVASVKGSPHRAMFPTSLIKSLIALSVPENGVVFDPFMGSGTTAIACIETGRQWAGYEINPEYYEYALQRIEDAHNTAHPLF